MPPRTLAPSQLVLEAVLTSQRIYGALVCKLSSARSRLLDRHTDHVSCGPPVDVPCVSWTLSTRLLFEKNRCLLNQLCGTSYFRTSWGVACLPHRLVHDTRHPCISEPAVEDWYAWNTNLVELRLSHRFIFLLPLIDSCLFVFCFLFLGRSHPSFFSLSLSFSCEIKKLKRLGKVSLRHVCLNP